MIRAVESGQEFVITRRGEPVARVVPVSRRRVLTPSQQAALERTRARMAHGYRSASAEPFDRGALHDR
jgi:antitoxin (DNA-binding transcriptional repressor) of toxin-antitoxin stability system